MSEVAASHLRDLRTWISTCLLRVAAGADDGSAALWMAGQCDEEEERACVNRSFSPTSPIFALPFIPHRRVTEIDALAAATYCSAIIHRPPGRGGGLESSDTR
ncbi:hypothetical protein K458DRAFT_383821 [Lentithecium fluviatile CBS 122367]|uniref:Uncharacterized protein n=1 Tax=Lentithecium fluviatile CBS 122367 TaxID=1168545 RepID=A0A6G1JG98_9PLEO|nr:hypothetical protein K458DRAFT_383821 [Lentithecium fluviatile CBS 122367]